KKISNVELVGYEIDKKYCSLAKAKNRWKNITFYNDDINNLTDFNFDIILTFLFEKQHKTLIYLYSKFPIGALIISNTFKIPFGDNNSYDFIVAPKSRMLMRKIYVYKKAR
ncbi:MAG: hypothetical protein LBB09_00075, partial [Rickettsiales bacterium]|nr:hypothetical protein [Rickettsiales bacterium]